MRTNQKRAFTLIEMIVVLAVVLGLASAALVPMIRHLDLLAQKKEEQTLKTMADAFKARIRVTKVITNQVGWANAIGSQLGWQLNDVSNNGRGLRRVFLISPDLTIGTNTSYSLPYIQTTNGHTLTDGSGYVIPPILPRLMLISSLSAPLPSSLTNGVGDTTGANAFTSLWSTPEDGTPSGWTTWSGRGEDFKVQRIDLSDLFVQIILNNRDTNLTPSYKIDDLPPFNPVGYGGRKPMYFLKGTELKLYNAAGALEYAEVLEGSRSFTFEFGTWNGEVFVANAIGQTSAIDLQRVMNLFMTSPANTNAQFGATQTVISNAFVGFLTNYIAWRDGSPSYDGQNQGQGNPPSSVANAQVNLSEVTSHLIAR